MRTFWLAALILLLPGFCFAQDNKLENLVKIRFKLETIESLEENNTISQETASQAKKKYLREAAEILHKKNITEDGLKSLTADVKLETPGTLSKLSRHITLINICWITAGLLFSLAIARLVYLYVIPTVAQLSAEAMQFTAYTVCLTVIGSAQALPSMLIIPVVFVGCLGLLGCLYLTETLYFDDNAIHRFFDTQGRYAIYSTLLTFAWAIAAISYNSDVIGFLATMAAVSALGFSVLITPFCYFIGFSSEAAVPRATFAAGFVLLIYSLTQLTGVILADYLEVFRTGVMFVGSFTYFIGMLIMSSKYYTENFLHYLIMQAMMILSGAGALVVGTLHHIETLQQIGGTLFYLYALEKYFEIPWGATSWAWITLFLSGLLYAGALFAQANPTYFLF